MPKRWNLVVVKSWWMTASLACAAVMFAGSTMLLAEETTWVERSAQSSSARSRVIRPVGTGPTTPVLQAPESVPENVPPLPSTSAYGPTTYGPLLGPDPTVDPTPTTFMPTPGAVYPGPVMNGNIGNGNDYWIVSSRKCKKRDRESGTNCCLHFFHNPQENQLQPVERQAFLGSINPAVPVCFVIHGSYNRWGDVVRESRRIHQWIRCGCAGQPLQVVFFSWPADGNLPFIFPVDIAMLGRRSSAHGPYLAQLVAELPPTTRVSMIGHSHGARVALSAMHVLGGGQIEDGRRFTSPAVPHRIRAVLLAPAVDHHWLNPGERYGQALCTAERVLLMRNHSDATMALYVVRKPFAEPSLGYRGPNQYDRMMLDGQNAKLVEMDVSSFVKEHAWAAYCRRPELAAALSPFAAYSDDAQGQPVEMMLPQTIQMGPTTPQPTLAEPTPVQPAPVRPTPVQPKTFADPNELSGPVPKPQRYQLPLAAPGTELALPPAPRPAAKFTPRASGKVRIEPTYISPLPSGISHVPTPDALPPASAVGAKPSRLPVQIELDEGQEQSADAIPLLVE